MHAFLLLCILALAACSSGGGSDDEDSTQRVEISGTILEPGGTASLGNPIGLQGAANRAVSLYRIDDEGNIIGDVLDTATSDASGNYLLLLPSNISITSDLIVEAQLDDSNPPEIARAIVLDESTDVTPITEYITQKLIDDPTLDLSALPPEEVEELVEFVESLPLEPQPDLSSMLVEIADFSDPAVEAEIDDLATENPQIRLSGLLSIPSSSPRPGSALAARGGVAIPNQEINLYRIDNDGTIIGSPIATTTTNSEGVFTLLLPLGEDLSADLMLQAVVGTDVVRALVTSEQLDIDATSEYVFQQVTGDPDTVVAELPPEEVYSIVEFIYAQDIPEGATLSQSLTDIDTTVGSEVAIQIDSVVVLGASEPGFFGTSNWNAASFQ